MDRKNTAIVKVTKKRGKTTIRHFSTRNLKGRKSDFIAEALAEKDTKFVTITPREYGTSKMSRESDQPGGYDLRKAKEVLGLPIHWYDGGLYNYQSKQHEQFTEREQATNG